MRSAAAGATIDFLDHASPPGGRGIGLDDLVVPRIEIPPSSPSRASAAACDLDLSIYIAMQPFGVAYDPPGPISFPTVEHFPGAANLNLFG